tara:strand:- start:318 stop:785 length:468 start_codon:yes stop_codon:yes gene_type:complete
MLKNLGCYIIGIFTFLFFCLFIFSFFELLGQLTDDPVPNPHPMSDSIGLWLILFCVFLCVGIVFMIARNILRKRNHSNKNPEISKNSNADSTKSTLTQYKTTPSIILESLKNEKNKSNAKPTNLPKQKRPNLLKTNYLFFFFVIVLVFIALAISQ